MLIEEVKTKIKNLWALGILFVLVISLCFSGNTQESKQEDQKMIEAYMKLMAVTENRAYFKNFAGEWDIQTTAWMQLGAEPFVAQNSSKAEVIFGGRFLKMRFKGTMFGQSFEGLQIVGNDNSQKKYITFWIDSSSTGFYLTSGTRDESGKVMTETGEWPDPMTGGRRDYKSTGNYQGDQQRTFPKYS